MANMEMWRVRKFNDDLRMMAQQKNSIFSDKVEIETNIVGDRAYFDYMGPIEMLEKTTRFEKTPNQEFLKERVEIRPRPFHSGVKYDQNELDRMLSSMEGPTLQSFVAAYNRLRDRVIYNALIGSRITVDEDLSPTSTALPDAQIVAVDYGSESGNTNLTIAKLRRALAIFEENQIPINEDGFMMYAAMNASAKDSLLGVDQIISRDYNPIPVLPNGQVPGYLGFNFAQYQGVYVDPTTSIAKIVCWAKPAARVATIRDFWTKYAELPDESFAHQLYSAADFGATRSQQNLVVVILCDQSA